MFKWNRNKTPDDMIKSAMKISAGMKCNVLVKGGHLEDCADDLLYENGNTFWFKSKKIDNPNTHGTGCTLSSAIACNLADGKAFMTHRFSKGIYYKGLERTA